MKLNNRFIFGILSLVLAAVIAFVALPTIARQTNGKAEIVRITQPVLKGEIPSDNAEVVEVGGYNLPSNVAHSLSDVEGLYVTADLAEGDYILTSKVSSVPVSSDVALNDIPSGKVAILRRWPPASLTSSSPTTSFGSITSWRQQKRSRSSALLKCCRLPIPMVSMWTTPRNPRRTKSGSNLLPSQFWRHLSRPGSSQRWKTTASPMWP